ncbi:mersacidin/lichenicidin family type 2 lantibiotic [Dictyobacter formicarum]|uniref:Mersacidin/lichenicidin family type 2 lantibiotic n=1 Tax=Dictyobacter formicarum TaxID=2778368 RepID=A0ABQ3VMP1_9CHLR|nr:mersacidin/lichenicidin family type 2 lantibiotic [Dictyobacter formicarum]GHO87492.1 hypothetical protein KSZ_54980 [Dictyobacter formicarum]
MSIDIARAWKDAQYSESLSSEERAQLPQSPIGSIELADDALATVNGAFCGRDPFLTCGLLPVDPIPGFRRSGGPWYRGGFRRSGGYGFFGGGECGYEGGSWYGGYEGGCGGC